MATVKLPLNEAHEELLDLNASIIGLATLVEKEKNAVYGEMEALTSVKFDVLHAAFTEIAAKEGTTPESFVGLLETWGFGSAPRKALIRNGTKTDEMLYARLRDSVASKQQALTAISDTLLAQRPAAQHARDTLSVKAKLDALQSQSWVIAIPELTSENYRTRSLVLSLFSGSYREVWRSLKSYEEKHGDLFAKIPQSTQIFATYTANQDKAKTAMASLEQARQQLKTFEAEIVIPVSDAKFIEQQVTFACNALAEEDEFPLDKREAILETQPTFSATLETFAKMQAQRRVAGQQLEQFPALTNAVKAWTDKLAPLLNTMERHRANKKATVTLPLPALTAGIAETSRAVNAMLKELAVQRQDAARITGTSRSTAQTTLQQQQNGAAVRSDNSTTQTYTDTSSSDFWLMYLLLSNQSQAHSASGLAPLALPEVPLDHVTSSLATLYDLDLDIGSNSSQTSIEGLEDSSVDAVSLDLGGGSDGGDGGGCGCGD